MSGSASCRNRDDSRSAFDLWSYTYVYSASFPSFVYPSFARSFSSPSTYIFRESTYRLARSFVRARERIVRANRTSRTRRRGHGALCLSSARNLLRSLVKRTPGRKKKRRATQRNGARRYDSMQLRVESFQHTFDM